jgi:hypothetical protein
VNPLASLKEHVIHQLLTLEEMGYGKLSPFLMHLRSLIPDMPNIFLHSI